MLQTRHPKHLFKLSKFSGAQPRTVSYAKHDWRQNQTGQDVADCNLSFQDTNTLKTTSAQTRIPSSNSSRVALAYSERRGHPSDHFNADDEVAHKGRKHAFSSSASSARTREGAVPNTNLEPCCAHN